MLLKYYPKFCASLTENYQYTGYSFELPIIHEVCEA